MWSKAFWKATAERAVRAGAAALLALWVVGDGVLDIANLHVWWQALVIFISGAIVSVLASLVGGATDKTTGPSLFKTEVPNP